MTDGELRALLRLCCIPGLGNRRLVALLRREGSAEAVLSLPLARLSPEADKRQLAPIQVRVERALRLMEKQRLELLAVHRAGYPVELQELADPPALLFGRGETSLLQSRSVAVVGTRRPTDYGVAVTEQLVEGLVQAGVTIWSGLARGIDGVAHRAALAAGGATVAVLGSGIDVAYPREHAALLEEIAGSGLVLSEFMPGEPPLAHHFPQRNRIIARLAHGVLVVEARADGGALITADAGSGSRPIMAVPGPITAYTSIGPNRLIQDGAKLVMEVADVLEEIGGPLNAAAARGRPSARRRWQKSRPAHRAERPSQLTLAEPPEPAQRPPAPAGGRAESGSSAIMSVLSGQDALHVDEIAARCGIGAGAVLSQLLELELAGWAEQLGGKRFRLARRPEPDRYRRPPPQEPGGN